MEKKCLGDQVDLHSKPNIMVNGLNPVAANTQHDGLKTTMKKGTPKILSKSISRMPMGSLVGH